MLQPTCPPNTRASQTHPTCPDINQNTPSRFRENNQHSSKSAASRYRQLASQALRQMYENLSHLSQHEDGKLGRRSMEKSSSQRHPERSNRNGKGSGRNGEKTGRRRVVSWEATSIFCQLLIAWLMTFGIFITARNFSPIGLELWANQFPVRTTHSSECLHHSC